MIGPTALFILATLNPPWAKAPAWMDYKIAGYSLAYDTKHNTLLVVDPKTRYFVLRDVVCDGGYVTLELTRDRAEIEHDGSMTQRGATVKLNYDGVPSVVKPLPSLTTGKGIKIGDTPAIVKTKLGPPTKHVPSGSRDQYLDFDYIWHAGRTIFTETYTFKKGKLIQITFVRDSTGDDGSPTDS